MSPFTKLTSTLAIASLAALACRSTELNPDHCANNDGDAYCATLHPDGARPYCEVGTKGCITPGRERLGCVAERPQDECYSPCGATLPESEGCQSGSETIEVTSSASTTSDTTTSDPASDDTAGPCTDARDCPNAAAPFCEPVTATCVACDAMEDPDGACAELDPAVPLCTDGTCVQCTPENPMACDEGLLVCDGSTGACVACTEHAQCSSGACELALGLCFPADAVRFDVDGDGGADHMTIGTAIGAVPNNGHGVIVVHELDGAADYGPTITSGGNKTIALLAATGEVPIIQGNSTPGLRVTGMGTTLYMDGLTLALNGSGLGLRVDTNAFAWVDRSRIVQNSGGGILVEDGTALTLRNSFVGLNGGQFADTRGITAMGATLDIAYTTVAANDGTGASGPISLSCDAASTGTVRNGIVAAGTSTIACPNVSFSASVVDTAGLEGSDNEVLSFDPAWFPGIASADFHIAVGPPFADVAQWQTGDPTTDIDGNLRPTVDGTPDYAGADVP